MPGPAPINMGIIQGLHTSIPPQDITYQYFGDICNSPELVLFFNVIASQPFPFIWDSDRGSITYKSPEASTFISFQKAWPATGQGNIIIMVDPEIDQSTGRVLPGVPQRFLFKAQDYPSTIDFLAAVYAQIISLDALNGPFPTWESLNIAAMAAQIPEDKSLIIAPPVNNPQFAPI